MSLDLIPEKDRNENEQASRAFNNFLFYAPHCCGHYCFRCCLPNCTMNKQTKKSISTTAGKEQKSGGIIVTEQFSV